MGAKWLELILCIRFILIFVIRKGVFTLFVYKLKHAIILVYANATIFIHVLYILLRRGLVVLAMALNAYIMALFVFFFYFWRDFRGKSRARAPGGST